MSGAAGVPFVDLERIHEELRGELDAAIARVVDSGAFVLGEELERFEQEFADYLGVEHCVGVGSGTSALQIALIAAGIKPGDEVIVPAHTFLASALGILHAGAIPVFCDVRADDGLIDLDHAATLVGERTAAVLPVHLYGQACDPSRMRAFAKAHGLSVIEDAAQAHGAARGGVKAGAMGTASAFSFYPSKNLGAFGDGGAICTDDGEIAARARRLRDLGQQDKGVHVVIGYNERLDPLQAAVLRVKLPHLDRWNSQRIEAAAAYRAALPEGITPLPDYEPDACVYHLFAVRCEARELVREAVSAAGIGVGLHYFPAAHQQPPLAAWAPAEPLPEAEAWARQTLSLPMFAGIRPAEIELACAALASAAGTGAVGVGAGGEG